MRRRKAMINATTDQTRARRRRLRAAMADPKPLRARMHVLVVRTEHQVLGRLDRHCLPSLCCRLLGHAPRGLCAQATRPLVATEVVGALLPATTAARPRETPSAPGKSVVWLRERCRAMPVSCGACAGRPKGVAGLTKTKRRQVSVGATTSLARREIQQQARHHQARPAQNPLVALVHSRAVSRFPSLCSHALFAVASLFIFKTASIDPSKANETDRENSHHHHHNANNQQPRQQRAGPHPIRGQALRVAC